MDESTPTQFRKARRANVLLAATLEIGGAVLPVKLRNLSSDGALLDGDALPAAGTQVKFHRKDLSVSGRVAWVHGRHAGIAFDQPLEPQVVLRHVPSPRQKFDGIFRRPGFKHELTAEEMRLVERWR